MYYNSEFIVLKRINYADNDRIVTLLSPDKGKITAIAKGSRKLTSRLAAGIELFTHCKGHFAKGRNLDILTQVELIQPFSSLRTNFDLINKIFYLLELCYTTVQEQQENTEIFDLLYNTLDTIQNNTAISAASVTFFEMKLLSILGFRPQLYTCTNCNQPLTTVVKCGVVDHGIICWQCLKSSNNSYCLITISGDQLKQMQKLQGINWDNYLTCCDSFFPVNQIPGIFLEGIIGKKLKTKKCFL